MLATWSVRTYNILMRNKLEVETPEQAIAAGDLIIGGKVRNAGLKCASELYRAAGLGVYPIVKKLKYQRSIDIVKTWCEHFDRYTFHYDMRGLE